MPRRSPKSGKTRNPALSPSLAPPTDNAPDQRSRTRSPEQGTADSVSRQKRLHGPVRLAPWPFSSRIRRRETSSVAHPANHPPWSLSGDLRLRHRAARRCPRPHRKRHLPHRRGRPHRPGRPQRRRQDHPHQGPRRRGPARRRQRHPLRRGRLPPAGPAHRRPRRARPRPRPVRPRPGRADPQDARQRAAHRQRPGRHPREGAQAVRAPGDGVPHQGRIRRRGRGRHHRRRAQPARPGAGPAPAHALRRSAPPYRAGPDPVLGRGHPAARRADQPPRRGLDRLAARLPEDLHAAASS